MFALISRSLLTHKGPYSQFVDHFRAFLIGKFLKNATFRIGENTAFHEIKKPLDR